MEWYFPQDMHFELWHSYGIPPASAAAPAAQGSEDMPHADTNTAPPAEANEDAGSPVAAPPAAAPPTEAPMPAAPPAEAPPATAAPQGAAPPAGVPPPEILQAEARYSVVHIIQYSPWSPTPVDERVESCVIGTCRTRREANELAMKEVYEKYGELAHLDRGPWDPPSPTWLRKAGAGAWPNTWKIDDGLLTFSLVNSKLHYTLTGKVYVVKC
ncbi:hypothetical protein GGS24DRAFT_516348 [Hypoxylon argillaceum]|nr:hypothetical protein GGS24DRAFT_516348 [Hypoxylon argillaceum]